MQTMQIEKNKKKEGNMQSDTHPLIKYVSGCLK